MYIICLLSTLFLFANSSRLDEFAYSHLRLNHLIFISIGKCTTDPFVINKLVKGTPDHCGIVTKDDVKYFNAIFMTVFIDGSELLSIYKHLGLKNSYRVVNHTNIVFLPDQDVFMNSMMIDDWSSFYKNFNLKSSISNIKNFYY